MKLSRNFTLNELTKSQTATRMGIDNTPTDEHINNLERVCRDILQPVRLCFGKPFTPSSGYRSEALCEAIGSSKNSQHAKGEAADFEVPGIRTRDLAIWIRDNLTFDQLILEYYDPKDPSSGWVHCSITEDDNRNQCLTFDGKTYHNGIL
jgi:hypothetical protein